MKFTTYHINFFYALRDAVMKISQPKVSNKKMAIHQAAHTIADNIVIPMLEEMLKSPFINAAILKDAASVIEPKPEPKEDKAEEANP